MEHWKGPLVTLSKALFLLLLSLNGTGQGLRIYSYTVKLIGLMGNKKNEEIFSRVRIKEMT